MRERLQHLELLADEGLGLPRLLGAEPSDKSMDQVNLGDVGSLLAPCTTQACDLSYCAGSGPHTADPTLSFEEDNGTHRFDAGMQTSMHRMQSNAAKQGK